MRFKEWIDEQQQEPPRPEWWYHVTVDPRGILQSGFLTADQQGGNADVLGGSIRNAVSFTTEQNARRYYEGMQIWQNAALDILSFDEKLYLNSLATRYGVRGKQLWDELNAERQRWQAQRYQDADQKALFNFLQRLSMMSRGRFPLIMGSSYPKRLVDGELAIIKVRSEGPQQVRWNPGEEEWKVFDPEKLDRRTIQITR